MEPVRVSGQGAREDAGEEAAMEAEQLEDQCPHDVDGITRTLLNYYSQETPTQFLSDRLPFSVVFEDALLSSDDLVLEVRRSENSPLEARDFLLPRNVPQNLYEELLRYHVALGRKLYNRTKARVFDISPTAAGSGLRIEFERADYWDYVRTNASLWLKPTDPRFTAGKPLRDMFAPDMASGSRNCANHLGVDTLLAVRDSDRPDTKWSILLPIRSGAVRTRPNTIGPTQSSSVDFPGASLQPPKPPCPFERVYLEMENELRVMTKDIEQLVCIGAYREWEFGGKPQLAFFAKYKGTEEQFCKDALLAIDSWEIVDPTETGFRVDSPSSAIDDNRKRFVRLPIKPTDEKELSQSIERYTRANGTYGKEESMGPRFQPSLPLRAALYFFWKHREELLALL